MVLVTKILTTDLSNYIFVAFQYLQSLDCVSNIVQILCKPASEWTAVMLAYLWHTYFLLTIEQHRANITIMVLHQVDEQK